MSKKIKKQSTYIRNTGVDTDSYLSSVIEYDEQGNILSQREYDQDNNLISLIEIKYNDKLLPIEEITDHIEDGFGEKHFMEYDETGKLVSKKTEYYGGAWSVKKYERFPEEKKMIITTYDEDDEVEETRIVYFDEEKRIIQQEEYDYNGKLTDKFVNVFDPKTGNLIKKEEYINPKKPEKINFYYYNERNKFQGIRTENHKGKVLDWIKIDYMEDGRAESQTMMSGMMIKLEYNDTELYTKETHLDSSGNILNEKFTYRDKEGNLIREKSQDIETIYKYEWY